MNWRNIKLTRSPEAETISGGEGVEIYWGVIECSLGEVLVAMCKDGVRFLAFNTGEVEQLIGEEWPAAVLTHHKAMIADFVEDSLDASDPSSLDREVRVIVKGTDMQLEVWSALLRIPSGKLWSYGEVAAEIDRPKAVRAVATAIGCNPVSYFIPCHRVIRKSGELGGYRWGLHAKRILLERESDQTFF